MSHRAVRRLTVSALIGVGACGSPTRDEPVTLIKNAGYSYSYGYGKTSGSGYSGPGTSLNGTSLNGTSLNGSSLNGTSLNGTSLNGVSLNGSSLNGSSLNDVSLNGSSLNGSSLNGSSLNGSSLNGSSLNGTSLNGTSLNGSSLNGTDFIGALFPAELSNGMTTTLRIDDMRAEDEIWYYTVSVAVDGGWALLCGADETGAAVEAIPFEGVWNNGDGVPGGGSKTRDASRITFGCRPATLAKCAELGYRPWIDAGLESLHQTCTRALRADYCGDGHPWTFDGRFINIYDLAGVQADTENWVTEAEWDEDGAACITKRVKTHIDRPGCYEAKLDNECGKKKSDDWAIRTERDPGDGFYYGKNK